MQHPYASWIILSLGLWAICLPIAIVKSRKGRNTDGIGFLFHIASVIGGAGLAVFIMATDGTIPKGSIGMLSCIGMALAANIIITLVAGNAWPHCKKCGTEMTPTNYEVGRGTEDQGHVVIATCPNKCPR